MAWCSRADVPKVKLVAIAAHRGAPYILPSRESVQNRSYPLSRGVFMYLKHAPGQQLDPKVREFKRYVLSREGQAGVAKNGAYLPMTAQLAGEELLKVNGPGPGAPTPP